MADLMTEPFFYRADEIANLTDYQIVKMVQSQAEKVRRMNKEANGGVGPPGKIDREVAIRALMRLGRTREDAERVYDSAIVQH